MRRGRVFTGVTRASGLAVLAASALLAGCGESTPEPEERRRPVRYQQVYSSGSARIRSFTGVAEAGQKSRLSFKVGGTLQYLGVNVGSRVQAGELIATLDETDYRLQVEEAQASLNRQQATLRNASANYARIESLYEANNAALSDLDVARAQYETAEAGVRSANKSLALAQSQLDYTRLDAPVDGAIAETGPEVNENVQAGQMIAILTSGDRIEVQVSVPEQLIARIQPGQKVVVGFDALPGRRLSATITEVAVSSIQSASTTFPVKARLDEATPNVRPGMAAEVAFTFDQAGGSNRIYVPASAVGEDIHGRFAFVVAGLEGERGVARRIGVVTGELTASGLEIVEGLSDGDLLITAGVNKLIDGTPVRLVRPVEDRE